MSDSFESHPNPNHSELSPEAQAKRKLWKNLFFGNLIITLFLIGIFWLPVKLRQLDTFVQSPSVNQNNKNRRGPVGGIQQKQVPVTNPNLLPAKSIVVDATNEEQWTYFDFSRGKQVKIMDPSSLEWDLAFRRGKIITNGGKTNKFGKAGVLNLGEVAFDAVESVPLKEFVADKATRTETENPVLINWYKYNYITHKLTARKNVYVLRTADGKYAKVQYMSFYCADKQPGCIQMKYVYQAQGTKTFLKQAEPASPPATVAASPEISGS